MMSLPVLFASVSVVASAHEGPCDIYEAAGTPCVAAHSMVRAMYAAYEGPMYEVRRTSDNTTKVISVKAGTGFADSKLLTSFCSFQDCIVDRIFDQSPMGNHLLKIEVAEPNKHRWPNNGINATRDQLLVGGHTVYSAYFEGGQNTGVGTIGFRCLNKNGTAVLDEPESMYAVFSGTHYNGGCCFDYGNAELLGRPKENVGLTGPPHHHPYNPNDPSNGKMEAIYWGNGSGGSRHPGSGNGPWVMADLEEGVWAGDNADLNPRATPINAQFVTAMLKGEAGRFTLKGGDAQSGPLKTFHDGKRPKGYNPMKKQGAIVLGVGGDNSDFGVGTFYEGAMTAKFTSDATDNAVQANIVAAGYGQSTGAAGYISV